MVMLGRKENFQVDFPIYKWDINNNYIDERVFDDLTDVVHLAGAGIADRPWTNERKSELIESRVKSASLLIDVIKSKGIQLRSFIGASAIGYYGAVTTDKIFTETDDSSTDFMGTCCKLWEDSYQSIMDSGVRTCIVRVGVVMAREGGALKKLVPPVRCIS